MYFLSVHHSAHCSDMKTESHSLVVDGLVLRFKLLLPFGQCTWHSAQDFVGHSDLCVSNVLTCKIAPCSILDPVYECLVADGKLVVTEAGYDTVPFKFFKRNTRSVTFNKIGMLLLFLFRYDYCVFDKFRFKHTHSTHHSDCSWNDSKFISHCFHTLVIF